MPSFRAFHWSFAIVLPVVFGGCIFRSGDDHDHRYFCEGPGCYDDGDGVGAAGAGAQGAGGQTSDGGGGQGQGGEGGAPPSCDPNEVICGCSEASACPGDLTCVGGQCLATCGFDYDCGPGLVCGNGQCVPGCDDETPCGAGYACVGGGCLIDPQSPQCIDSSGCDGLECIGGFCTTACATHADCGPGQLCDGATLGCVADLAPVPLCDDTIACPGAGQACLSGTCHYECVDVLDCKLIDARFDACDEGFCKTDLEASPECTAASPCAGGEACVSNLCVPAG
jgi:hypothetical protein